MTFNPKHQMVRQASVRHAQPGETWTLTLSKYQRDNLLNLLNGAINQDERPVRFYNNGDWTAEVKYMLGKTYYDSDAGKEIITYEIDEYDSPNYVRES